MNINLRGVIAGRLTRDMEVRTTQGGTVIGVVGMAVNRRVKRNGAWADEPMFIDVKMFGARAEAFARFHRKGDQCCFVGAELMLEQWESDGQRRSRHVLVADGFEFVGAKQSSDDRDHC